MTGSSPAMPQSASHGRPYGAMPLRSCCCALAPPTLSAAWGRCAAWRHSPAGGPCRQSRQAVSTSASTASSAVQAQGQLLLFTPVQYPFVHSHVCVLSGAFWQCPFIQHCLLRLLSHHWLACVLAHSAGSLSTSLPTHSLSSLTHCRVLSMLFSCMYTHTWATQFIACYGCNLLM